MDLQAFMQASLAPREDAVPVPELKAWFKDAEPVWRVRSLTAAELGRASEQADRGSDQIRSLVKAMAGEGDKAEAIRSALGISAEDVPKDVTRRIEMLTMGSVEPKLGIDQRDVAVKLAESFPTTFFALTNRILALTGQGSEPGKAKRSTQTQG